MASTKVDVVIEAVGKPETWELAVRLVRKDGGEILVSGSASAERFSTYPTPSPESTSTEKASQWPPTRVTPMTAAISMLASIHSTMRCRAAG